MGLLADRITEAVRLITERINKVISCCFKPMTVRYFPYDCIPKGDEIITQTNKIMRPQRHLATKILVERRICRNGRPNAAVNLKWGHICIKMLNLTTTTTTTSTAHPGAYKLQVFFTK